MRGGTAERDNGDEPTTPWLLWRGLSRGEWRRRLGKEREGVATLLVVRLGGDRIGEWWRVGSAMECTVRLVYGLAVNTHNFQIKS
jgi:hypothetical protein